MACSKPSFFGALAANRVIPEIGEVVDVELDVIAEDVF